jgi:phage gpG-like protein
MPGRVTFKKGAKVGRIETNLDNPQAALKQIGVLMVAESQRAFKAQQFGAKKWDQRAPINVFGIIADFTAGKTKPPNRRFDREPALRDTGRLSSSIAYQVQGKIVEVGTNLEYAAVHQTGGETESKPLTESVQKKLARWLKKQPTELQDRLGWLTDEERRGDTLKQTVPARPFVGITPETRKTITKALGVKIMEVGK